jgi:ERCC4-related helicase
MLKFVHRPTLRRLEYVPCDPENDIVFSPVFKHLNNICRKLKAVDQAQSLRFETDVNGTSQQRHSTLGDQLVKFYWKAIHIYVELGPWAADYFILESFSVLDAHEDTATDHFSGGSISNRELLLKVLNQSPLLQMLQNRSSEGPFLLSAKVERLLAFLNKQDFKTCSGLLFVQQRATVSVLCTLLSLHPQTRDRVRCATFVGLSNNAARRYTLAELLDLKAQSQTLAEFRARKKNIIVATNALEEGIDVTACNLVVCFDPPPNLKSFIQRRGRARQEKSQFAIMFPVNEGVDKLRYWRVLEEDLIREYQNEQREIQKLGALEDDTEIVPGTLKVKSTG